MERIGVRLDPDQLVSTLSIGERQRVEIVKALFHDCRVVILDEPTAVLTPQDVRALFDTIAASPARVSASCWSRTSCGRSPRSRTGSSSCGAVAWSAPA